ncbi:DMT family transporter [Proteus cibarius]|uniref:DMT family transporter n=1 Tax=Proteus terrae subsp. cibarius TaxID=626774 RepID=A0A6G6SUI0_9GAMM|nr:DMT family transporter [Proteus terrae]QHP76458.1 DMT family transporter [Proteus vulgaris]MBG2914537.1 DMT family transporter [Proteus terrae subsp. cibarius]MBG3092027.1 DMT family transporter [Proteus terrae subsp. cibarius]MBG6037994.1 DMT family transporter [Proteus terrae subsp. cibarius]MCO4179283.1 DMT family transporter [Proteus terrae]
MSVFILIALFNGVCIVTSRTLNGKLAQNSNAFYSSLINHLVGFIFLTIFVLWVKDYHAIELSTIPLIAFAGGIIGAFFVVINSYVLPLLGVMLTSVLAICGQMISSLVIDIFSGIESNNLLLQIIGVLLIIGGVLIKFTKQSK